MAELFDTAKSTISEHLSNIYASGELTKNATVRNFRTVQRARKKNRNLLGVSSTPILTSLKIGYSARYAWTGNFLLFTKS